MKEKAEKYVPNSPQINAWFDEFEALPTVSARLEKGPGILTRILHENPNCYAAHYYLGELMFIKNNVKVAMEHFEKAKKSIELNVPSIEVDIHKARLKKKFIFFFTHAMKLHGLGYESHLKKLVKMTKQEWVNISDEVICSIVANVKDWSGENLARCRDELLRSIQTVGEADASNVERYKQLIVIEKVLFRTVVERQSEDTYSDVYYYDKYDRALAPVGKRIEEYKLALQILSPQAYEEMLQKERDEKNAKKAKGCLKSFLITLAIVAVVAIAVYYIKQ